MRALVVLAAITAVLAGCRESSPHPPPPAEPVRMHLRVAPEARRDRTGNDRRADRAVAVAITRGERVVVRGTVEPASSDVELVDGATLEQAAVAHRRGASFAFTLEHVRPGESRYVVEGAYPGRAAARRVVRILRRAPRARTPRTVIVPPDDATPAEAELRLDPRRLVAVAIGRDPEGMARIRVSAELRLRCRTAGGTRTVPFVRHDPPPRIGEVRVVPGVRAPTELRRRSDVYAAARARCAASGASLAGLRGVVWAEATNARGRDRYSADVPLAR